MAVDKGPMPTDGQQDSRQYIRCSACLHFDRCYRGPEMPSVTDEHDNVWRHWQWLCPTCFAVIVGEALRDIE